MVGAGLKQGRQGGEAEMRVGIMPEVSIIVPVYNSEKYLSKCIDSIINQTFQDYELILIDDGSNDNSGSICDLYEKKDNRIKAIHQKNSGVSVARNKGISVARGRFISFIDSDDYVYPDMIGEMVHTMDNYNTEMAICGYRCVNENGDIIREVIINQKAEAIWSPEQTLIEIFALPPTINGYCWNKMFRKELISNEFENGIRIGEDLLFVVQYLNNIKSTVYISRALYSYRKYRGSATSGYSSYKYESYLDLLKVYKRVSIFEADNKHISSLIRRRYYDACLWVYNQTSNDRTIRRQIKDLLRRDIRDIILNKEVSCKLKLLCIRVAIT